MQAEARRKGLMRGKAENRGRSKNRKMPQRPAHSGNPRKLPAIHHGWRRARVWPGLHETGQVGSEP